MNTRFVRYEFFNPSFEKVFYDIRPEYYGNGKHEEQNYAVENICLSLSFFHLQLFPYPAFLPGRGIPLSAIYQDLSFYICMNKRVCKDFFPTGSFFYIQDISYP